MLRDTWDPHLAAVGFVEMDKMDPNLFALGVYVAIIMLDFLF